MQRKYLFAMILPVIAMIAMTPTVFASNGVGAIHLNQADACAMISPIHDLTSGDDTYGMPILTGSIKDVLTPSGNENIVCKTTVAGYNGPAVSFDGSSSAVLCSSAYGAQVTSDWHEEVSASGKATFVCHITGVTP